MRADQKIGRYVLNSRLSIDPGLRSGYDIQLWKAYDTVLDRHVTIRAIIEDDPRVNGVLGAARAAALRERLSEAAASATAGSSSSRGDGERARAATSAARV
jgi:hypothetical protein